MSRQVLVRRKIPQDEKGGSLDNRGPRYIVARKLKMGETIPVGDKAVTMPGRVSNKPLVMVPESLATKPPVQSVSTLPSWGMLGSPEDFLEFEEATQRESQEAEHVLSSYPSSSSSLPSSSSSFSNQPSVSASAHLRSQQQQQQQQQSGDKKQGTSPRLAKDELNAATERIELRRARMQEKRMRKQQLKSMLYEHQIVEMSESRSLARWKDINKSWAKIQRGLVKKLGSNPDKLLMARDDFRMRREQYELLEKSTPLHIKFGTNYWQMRLRNQSETVIPVGNRFSGLFCKKAEIPNSHIELVRKVNRAGAVHVIGKKKSRRNQLRTANAQREIMNSQAFTNPAFQKRARLQKKHIAKLRPVTAQELYNVDDLIIRGRDLFDLEEASSDDEPDYLPADEDVNNIQMNNNNDNADNGSSTHRTGTYILDGDADLYRLNSPLIDAEALSDDVLDPSSRPNQVTGPAVDLSSNRLLFQCILGQVDDSYLSLANIGSTMLEYQWLPYPPLLPSQVPPPPSARQQVQVAAQKLGIIDQQNNLIQQTQQEEFFGGDEDKIVQNDENNNTNNNRGPQMRKIDVEGLEWNNNNHNNNHNHASHEPRGLLDRMRARPLSTSRVPTPGHVDMIQDGGPLPKSYGDGKFWCYQTQGTLVPGASSDFAFTFTPSAPGVFLHTLFLHTSPALPSQGTQDTISITLKGVCTQVNNSQQQRKKLLEQLQLDRKERTASDVLNSIVRNVRTPEPDESDFRKIFYQRNYDERLWYYPNTFVGFQQLAYDVISCHKRAVRQTLRWDYCVQSLRELINTIPPRNATEKTPLMERLDKLVSQAKVRPAEDPVRLRLMSSLLKDIARDVPRQAYSLRKELDITQLLPEDKEKLAEDKKQAERAALILAAKKARRPPPRFDLIDKAEEESKVQLTPEEKEAQLRERAEARAERNQLENEYINKLEETIRNALSQAILNFCELAQDNCNNPQADRRLEFLALQDARPVRKLGGWGNDVLLPDVKKNETPEETRERLNQERRARMARGRNYVEEVKIPLVWELKPAVMVAAGEEECFGITDDNFVYRWPTKELADAKGKKTSKKKKDKKKGKGKKGAATVDEEEEVVPPPVPTRVPELQGFDVRKMITSPQGLYFVTQDNKLYRYYQYEESDQTEAKVEEILCKARFSDVGEPVWDVAVGQDPKSPFVIVLMTNGQLWSYGTNGKNGLCGNGDKKAKNVEEPAPLDPEGLLADHQFVSIVSGNAHTLALTTQGLVFSWGAGDCLGHRDKKPRQVPTQIPQFSPINDPVVRIYAGATCSMAVTRTGRLYSWGKGGELQLGLGTNKDIEVPTQVEFMDPAKFAELEEAAAEGKDSKKKSSKKSARDSARGNLGSRGSSRGSARTSKTPRSGRGDKDRKKQQEQEPVEIEGLPVTNAVFTVAIGTSHVVALTEEGVFTWGKGARGALGHGDEEDVWEPKQVKRLVDYRIQAVDVAAGGCHSFIFMDGDINEDFLERP